ncbi:MAG: DUF1697 domain-containing protein [Corynebacterium sp.]|nr:DUF1697 domain-containing protein [Corynebacterium sp.]
MEKYALLLRGINIGGKNKVAMADLRRLVADVGFQGVQTYINSGNLFFDTDLPSADVCQKFEDLFATHYPFVQNFSLFSAAEYERDYGSLPDWWFTDLARKDVLFFTEKLDKAATIERVKTFPLHDEIVHFGELGIYWGKKTETEFLKTTYHKKLLKEAFYKQVTVRNGKTAEKILALLRET